MSKATASSNPAARPSGAAGSPTNLLPFDGEAYLIPNALSPEQADDAFSALTSEIDWRQERATLFGRKIPLPRLTAWYGDGAYAYSGVHHEPARLTPTLDLLKTAAEAAATHAFNSVLANLYRDGQDSMGWHSDDEATLGPDPVIAGLSLGCVRRFQFKHRQGGQLISLELGHGSCLIMRGRCQACWRHQLPKTKKPVSSRINLTFRALRRAAT